MAKPRSKATINPSPEQRVVRSVARIKRLRERMEQRSCTPDQKKGFNTEISRRTAELQTLKEQIESALK